MSRRNKKDTHQMLEDPAPKVESSATPPEGGKPPRYVVAEGRSVTSKKGILGPGDVAHPEYFQTRESYDKLKTKGFLVQEKNFGKKK